MVGFDKDRHKRRQNNFKILESFDPAEVKDFDDLLTKMAKTSFGGRTLGKALDVAEAMMTDKDCFKIFAMSGAMTPAKMTGILCRMIEDDMVDAIVTTGANIAHGFVENMGLQHYENPGTIPDAELYKRGYDRIYDTLECEANLDDAQNLLEKILEEMDHSKSVASYEITAAIGKYLQNIPGKGILKSAYAKNVPVIIPAFIDAEVALNWKIYNKKRIRDNKPPLRFEPELDLDYSEELALKAKKLGLFAVGGGSPRNYAQQLSPFLDAIRYSMFDPDHYFGEEGDPYIKKYSYAIRICPEPEIWGGLSGCTFEETKSWGKLEADAKYAEVPCDATIAWPILICALIQRLKK